MADKERIKRISAMLSERKDAKEYVRSFRCGGKKFDDGGYKDRLIQWSVSHPGALWQDTKEASDARDWLRKNAPDELSALYWNEPDDIRGGIDRRFIPKDALEKEMELGVSGAINDAGRDIYNVVDNVTAWMPGPVGTLNWLGHMGADIANGEYGKAAGSAAMAGLMGGIGRGVSKLGRNLMGRYSGLKNFGERVGNFLDDVTWNDARRSASADLWSRNLDARQKFQMNVTPLGNPEDAARMIDITRGTTDVKYNPLDFVAPTKDSYDSDLLDMWLKHDNPIAYDKLMNARRREINNRILKNLEIEPWAVSQQELDDIMDGIMDEHSLFDIAKRPGVRTKPGKSAENVELARLFHGDHIGLPGTTSDIPLSLDITRFTDELSRISHARDVAFDMLQEAGRRKMLSNYGAATNISSGDAYNPNPHVSGIVTYPMTERNVSRKPVINFANRPLIESYGDNEPFIPWISIGLQDHLTGNKISNKLFNAHYGTNLSLDPVFVTAHEVGHLHPSFNNSHLLDPAVSGFLMKHGYSPNYGNSYFGASRELRQKLVPKLTADPHDRELNENISDALGERVMLSLNGIHDWRSGSPYTAEHIAKLNALIGAKSRFQHFHPDVDEQVYLLNNGWAEGGLLEKYPGGGKFFRTNLQNESPLMYQPILPSVPDVPTPMRYEPLPHYGLYEYPSTTGMAESYPVTLPSRVPVAVQDNTPVPVAVEEEPVIDLFSDEAKARRRLKQRYAESKFNDSAVSDAGAMGAWQIMPITLKDYLGRGRGKQGDINNAEYNGRIRDWVMSIIPRDLQEFWSEDDSDINKLAKLYAAYNWGAGSLRNYLRKRQKAGKSIDDPHEWVEGLNPETRRYVKYLAFDEDFDEKTGYTTKQFEDAARARGYMADGGRLYEMGGPEKTYGDYMNEYNAAVKAWKEANVAAKNANKERWEYHDSLPPSVKYSPNFHWKNIPGLKQRIERENQLNDEADKRRSEYYKAGAAIGKATVEKYRGTKHDLLKYPDWARTEEGAIDYLVNDYIRESAGAQEVADYFNSYALSPGFQRIIDNQWKWGHDRHPYKRIYDFSNYGRKGFTSSAERMRKSLTELPMTTDGVFDMNAVPGMGFNVTGPGYHFIINTAAQPYNQEDKRFPYWFELTHEMMHDRNFFSSGQGEALDQNTNTAPGHDSWRNEKHSDLEALRFMLFKEGIYDSRGEKDCTPEDIAKMRKKWPNLRPLQQMDDEKAAWMINHVADAGEQESMYGNHIGNISANGGNLFRAGGPGGITGVSPINMLVPFVDKTIEKVSNEDTAEKVAKVYHDNADKIPPVLHRTIYDTIKDSAFSDNPLSEIKYNFFPNLYHNMKGKVDAFDNVFLMSPEQQEKQLSSLGAIKVDTSDGYGLVNDAVTRYRERTGRDVPMYQIGEDEITRDKLIPLNNDILARYFPTVNKVYRVVHDRDAGDIEYTYPFDQVSMGDIGAAPFRLYRDTDGNIYYKRWDFFDHGSSSRGHLDPDRQYYITKPLSSASEQYGDLLDMAGNPFVKTTGYTKVPDVKEALDTLPGVHEAYWNSVQKDKFYDDIIAKVKSGEFDIKASGGKIHIKPENRGKFTALKKRTGHSASWFKAHGTPAQKKMATFALNAKKWKHGDGGPIDRYSPEQIRAAIVKLKETRK